MYNSILFTIISVLTVILLVVAVVMQVQEMNIYELFFF